MNTQDIREKVEAILNGHYSDIECGRDQEDSITAFLSLISDCATDIVGAVEKASGEATLEWADFDQKCLNKECTVANGEAHHVCAGILQNAARSAAERYMIPKT